MNAIIIDDHPLAIAAIRNLLIKNDIEILAELTEGGSANIAELLLLSPLKMTIFTGNIVLMLALMDS